MEGPTKREALLVTAIDDIQLQPKFWLYAHVEADGRGHFTSRSLREYDPSHDYSPWVSQVRNDAIAWYVQQINQRVAIARLMGGSYLTRSPFRARLLAHKGSKTTPAHAAVWADVPVLPKGEARTLARAASEDEAVEDLRRQIRHAVRVSVGLGEQAEALSIIADDLAYAGRKLERIIRRERRWQAIVPAALGLGTVALGAAGGVPGLAAGALGTAASLLPYLATLANRRQDAAYLFFMAQRRSAREQRTRT